MLSWLSSTWSWLYNTPECRRLSQRIAELEFGLRDTNRKLHRVDDPTLYTEDVERQLEHLQQCKREVIHVSWSRYESVKEWAQLDLQHAQDELAEARKQLALYQRHKQRYVERRRQQLTRQAQLLTRALARLYDTQRQNSTQPAQPASLRLDSQPAASPTVDAVEAAEPASPTPGETLVMSEHTAPLPSLLQHRRAHKC